jgi:hypothetical protein
VAAGAAKAELVFLPERHTDFVFHVETDPVLLVLWIVALVAAVGLGLWWRSSRRR